METMTDWDLGAWGTMMEVTTGYRSNYMTNTGDRCIDSGRAGRLSMRITGRGWNFRDGI